MPSIKQQMLFLLVIVTFSAARAQGDEPILFGTVLDWEKVRIGDVVILDELKFLADSSEIMPQSMSVLDVLSAFLLRNPELGVEITGHTNTKPTHQYCDVLSEARAYAVKDYLVDMGVPSEIIRSIGMGKRRPLFPHDVYDRQKQQLNQRVEIRLLHH